MRLLLTRAAEDSARTREKLEAHGHRVIVSPVIEIVATGASWPTGVVDAMLATSAQAFTVPWAGPSREAGRVMPLYLVGARTVEVARARGYLGAVVEAKTAIALAVAIGRLASNPRRIVYVAGHDRKPDIEMALASLNLTLDVIEAYQARACATPSPEARKAFQTEAIDGVLHFSKRSAVLFTSAMLSAGLDIGQAAHFCLSEDVAAPLREAGCATIHVTEEPTEADLLSLVGRV